MSLLPTQAYLARGVGHHAHQLVAFELALREAGVAAQNLVTVSSILPPGCPIIARTEGERGLLPGQILHVVMSRVETCEVGQRRVASIGLARPTDPAVHGFIAEHDATNQPISEVESTVVGLASTMLATSLGAPPESVGESAEWASFEGIEETQCISAEAHCEGAGQWTVAVALCVLLIRDNSAESQPQG